MRVLQIVPSVSLVYGGPSQMVLGLAKALAAEGIDVTLLTTNSNGDAGQLPLDVPLQQPISQEGYEIIYFRCSPFRRYKFSVDLLRWLAKNANAYDIAHIHALFSPISTAAATVARMKKLPYLMRPLGTLDPADLQKKRQLKKIYGNLLEKPNLANAAGVHFTSEQEREISERFGAKTRDLVIPLGVELADNLPELGTTRNQLGIAAEKVLVLYMSRLDPKKGLDLLIPALEKLLTEGVDFHFVLAGGNPQNPDYERKIGDQIKGSKLANLTTITGFVTGETKLGLLQDADLFVLPSYYENFGIAVAEAMGAGTPVVISDQVHIWREVEEAEAGWVTKCEVESLTNTLICAIEKADLRRERGIKAKNLVMEKYSWDAIARQLITAYEEILAM
ncbi:MAG: hormogonium polysaccharide biosynthesis glycosyltransferase HpsP [Oscillatoria sp. PMC 1068.18]|nr:hormogonium polysaccharide biosynthesis glycosyltransferase HpsP [Oscillatoria sp. PMC 1076.18]MEC4987564.1 hormogonium polysaccharide biosynthesis glycosyltransferase HpsP [Oscillatoria sp. PMC 1068.18]